jgi:heat shock protein HslJ
MVPVKIVVNNILINFNCADLLFHSEIKIMKTIIFFALIACTFTSCAPTKTPAIGTTTTDNNISLLEGTWELNYITGPRIAFDGLYPDKKPTLIIDLTNKKISGTTGCNSYSGPLVAGNGDINFNQPIAVTRMACSGNGMLGETTYLELLKKIKQYSVTDGKTLNLIAGDIALMRFTKK